MEYDITASIYKNTIYCVINSNKLNKNIFLMNKSNKFDYQFEERVLHLNYLFFVVIITNYKLLLFGMFWTYYIAFVSNHSPTVLFIKNILSLN